MSIAAYAREHDVSAGKLYEARRAFRKRDKKFIEVDMDAGADAIPAPDAPLEILFPKDVRVRVPCDFDENALRRLVSVLASC